MVYDVTGTFGDADGDTITMTSTIDPDPTALPAWIVFNGTEYTISPDQSAGEFIIYLIADDGYGSPCL